jgi:hypothetical protein
MTLCLWALVIAAASAESPDCYDSSLEVDGTMLAATLRVVAHKEPVLDLRQWQISGPGLPGEHVYTLKIGANLLPQGREYPAVIRIAPATVAISLRELIHPEKPGFERLCDHVELRQPGHSHRSSQKLLEGYAFFQQSLPTSAPLMLADERIPEEFLGQYQKWLGRAQEFYRHVIGPRKQDVRSVLFLLDQDQADQSGCRFSGSSLPGLLLIGLRGGCLNAAASFPGGLPHFIAHEAFHQWNQEVQQVQSLPRTSRIMLLEGGAELAASVFLSQTDGSKADGIQRDVAAAAESCFDQAAYKRRPLNDLIGEGEHQLAYSCGMVYTFLRLVRIKSDPAVALGPFWEGMLAQPTSERSAEEVAFDDAFMAQPLLQKGMIDLLAKSGYTLQVATSGLDKNQQFRIAIELLREVSRNDCRGSYGLLTGGGEVVIDPEIERCKSLRPGGRPVAVGGFNLREEVLSARSAWLSACKNEEKVRIDYAESHTQPSVIHCLSPPKSLYTPYRLSPIEQRERHDKWMQRQLGSDRHQVRPRSASHQSTGYWLPPDWVIDLGPGAGSVGGTIVAKGTPHQVARAKGSRTAPFLSRELGQGD